MPIATTALLPTPQWRLCNLLFRHSLFTAKRQLGAMLRTAEADFNDLVDLHGAEMVKVHRSGASEMDASYHRLLSSSMTRLEAQTLINDHDVCLRLTSAGLTWVCDSVANQLVYAIAEHTHMHRGAKYRDVARAVDLDSNEVPAALVERGLVTVWEGDEQRNARDLRRVGTGSTPLNEQGWLKLTRAGDRVVNP